MGTSIMEALMIHCRTTNENPNPGTREPYRLAKLALTVVTGVALFTLPFAAAAEAAAQEAPASQPAKAKPKPSPSSTAPATSK